jgi:hypothetical protein
MWAQLRLDIHSTDKISFISSNSFRGGGLFPNLNYSPLEKEGTGFFISANLTEVSL